MPAPAPIPAASSSSSSIDELKAPSQIFTDGPDPASLSTEALRDALQDIIVSSTSSKAVFRNWAKTFECRPAVGEWFHMEGLTADGATVFEPTTVHQCRLIIELALRENQTVHPVGVGHSPSDLACTRGFMIRMEGLKGLVSVSSFV